MAEKQLKLIEREKELLDKDQTVSTLREEVGISDLHSAYDMSVYNVAKIDSAALLDMSPFLVRKGSKISLSFAV